VLKKNKFIVNAVVEADPRGGYSAFVPSMPGVITEGADMAELQINLQDAIKAWSKTAKSMKQKSVENLPSYILPIEVYA
jgi:predicted RNase H-like HicB family nuclease